MNPFTDGPLPALDPASADRCGIDRASLGQLLGFRLRRINIQLSRDFALATTDFDLRSGEYTSLAIISSNPGVSQNEICRATGLDKSAAVAVIDDLLKRKWVVRNRSDEDRRRYLLTTTPEGEQALAILVSRTRQIENPILSCLTDLERAMLFALLDKVVDRVLDDPN